MNPFSGSEYLHSGFNYPDFSEFILRCVFWIIDALEIFFKIFVLSLVAAVIFPIAVPAFMLIFFMLAKEDIENARKEKRT